MGGNRGALAMSGRRNSVRTNWRALRLVAGMQWHGRAVNKKTFPGSMEYGA